MVQITNWYAKPVGEVQITEERSQWQSREITVADSDLEVRARRVWALLAVGPLGLGFGLKTRGRIPPWPVCTFTTETDLTGD